MWLLPCEANLVWKSAPPNWRYPYFEKMKAGGVSLFSFVHLGCVSFFFCPFGVCLFFLLSIWGVSLFSFVHLGRVSFFFCPFGACLFCLLSIWGVSLFSFVHLGRVSFFFCRFGAYLVFFVHLGACLVFRLSIWIMSLFSFVHLGACFVVCPFGACFFFLLSIWGVPLCLLSILGLSFFLKWGLNYFWGLVSGPAILGSPNSLCWFGKQGMRKTGDPIWLFLFGNLQNRFIAKKWKVIPFLAKAARLCSGYGTVWVWLLSFEATLG